MSVDLMSLPGGALVGASAAALLLNGRVAGISGIAAGLLGGPDVARGPADAVAR